MDKSVHHVQAKHTTITNVSTQMPTLPSFFKAKSHPPQVTTYYLSNRFPDEPTGQAALEPIAYPRQIPTSSLLFSLTHPEPSQSPATAFFLDCLPDPIGFLHHSSSFIRSHLSLPASNPSTNLPSIPPDDRSQTPWRHQLIELVLEDSEGLAATSGGKIVVSLRWVDNVRQEVQDGRRELVSATNELKGVCM